MGKDLLLLKVIAGVLLLVSFFLPMSGCTYTTPVFKDPDSADVVVTGVRTNIHYANDGLSLASPTDWSITIPFIWPFIMVGIQMKWSGRKMSWLAPLAGVVMAGLSGSVIYFFVSMGEPLIGAWLGAGAVALLLAIHMAELYRRFVRRGEFGKGESATNSL